MVPRHSRVTSNRRRTRKTSRAQRRLADSLRAKWFPPSAVFDAVLFNPQVIGEAVKNLPESTRSAFAAARVIVSHPVTASATHVIAIDVDSRLRREQMRRREPHIGEAADRPVVAPVCVHVMLHHCRTPRRFGRHTRKGEVLRLHATLFEFIHMLYVYSEDRGHLTLRQSGEAFVLHGVARCTRETTTELKKSIAVTSGGIFSSLPLSKSSARQPRLGSRSIVACSPTNGVSRSARLIGEALYGRRWTCPRSILTFPIERSARSFAALG